MYDDIQKLGAEAVRKGLSILDCPYLRVDAMPYHTGEPIAQWTRRVEAWEAGWKQVRVAPRASARWSPLTARPTRGSTMLQSY
ncbi:MAG: CrpP-related protein [Pseudomonadales bacterium]